MEQYMWIVWLVVCFISLIVEVSISGLVSIWISIAALICLGLSFINGLPWWGEIIIFIGVGFILLLLTRPLVKKLMQNKEELNTNASSFIKQQFKLIKKVTPDEFGEVKINGVIWNVESVDKKEIEQGRIVEVIDIIGNRLIVKEIKMINVLSATGLGIALGVTFGVLGFLILIVIITHIKIVKQTNEYVIERLGKYVTTWHVGIHFLWPFFDRIASKVSMKEQIGDFLPQAVITKDNVTMQIDTVVFYYITDSKLFTYGVTDPTQALEKLTATTLRNIIGDLDLDTTLTSRDTINAKMKLILDEATDPWGIKVTRVEVKNILPPQDIRDAMERQMRAEREKREKILLAEGQKQSQILIAEGEKESTILKAEAEKIRLVKKAEAEAETIMKLKQAEAEGIRMINEAKPSKESIQLSSLRTLENVAHGQATKIIVPSSIQNLAALKDVFNSDEK